MTKTFLPLVKRARGRVVNLSSGAGKGKMLKTDRSGYCTKEVQGKHEMQSSVSLYFLSACSGRFLSA